LAFSFQEKRLSSSNRFELNPMEMQQKPKLLSKEEIRTFPAFQNLDTHNILVIQTLAQCLSIQDELYSIQVFGFDTESKPTFKVGEKSTGPHLVQLATSEKAYLFQVNPDILSFLKPILENEQQLKVGFGLKMIVRVFAVKALNSSHILIYQKASQVLVILPKSGYKQQLQSCFNAI